MHRAPPGASPGPGDTVGKTKCNWYPDLAPNAPAGRAWRGARKAGAA